VSSPADGPAPDGPASDGPASDGLRAVDVLTVASVRDVTPSVRRVALSGSPAAVAAAGPTVSLLVPRVGDPAPRWPRVAKDGRIVWPDGAHGVSLRSYTARRQDPAAGLVEIDFVLHGDGPAAAWAAAAVPGALLGSAGGGSLGERPAGQLLLAGDETALPAIARILAEAAPTAVGTALLEVAGPAEEQPLPAPAGVTVRWLHRGATPPGESTLLVDAIAGLDRPAGDDVFAWVAAESAAVRAIRADLRGRWGLGRAQHHAIGYWRRGRAMSPSG
jgi:NADPH-dependent ferric siderophore reductase